tara:strand:+ start:4663 stop:6825 length:2163 start_codon:yes stop_codon:yes gene_type:complete
MLRGERDLRRSLARAVENHSDFAQRAAEILDTDPAIILGFLVLESGGAPARLGENIHWMLMKNAFRKYFKRKFPGQSLPPSLASGRTSKSKKVWKEAYRLYPRAALECTSWGIGQHHPWDVLPQWLGYDSPEEMVTAFKSSVKAQEQGMIDYIRKKKRLHKAVKRRDWWLMGRYYNGGTDGRYGRALRFMYNILHPNDLDEQHIASSRDEWKQMWKSGQLSNKNLSVVPGMTLKQKKSGKIGKVFLAGDSNTTNNRKYWKAFIGKNFGSGVKVVDVSAASAATWDVLKKLKDADGASGIIIGSLGGNDPSRKGMTLWKDVNRIKKALEPEGKHYQKFVAPLFSRLQQLQNNGTKIIIFGLPFGRGKGERCNNNTPIARKAMDDLLIYASKEYGIDYRSVFEQTKNIKGDGCGPYYKDKNGDAYRDILRGKDPENSPTSDEEEKYANSIAGGKKIKISKSRGGRWFKKYKYIKKAGINFKDLYKMFESTFGSNWIKLLLPVHGKDFIFGPEHFAAFKKLAEEVQDLRLLALVRKKSSVKDDPIVAKAEKKAEDKIEKKKDKIEKAQDAKKVKPKVAKKKPIKIKPKPVKPVTFEQAIFASKKNDIIFLKLKKDVKKYGFTIFKKGKTYKAKILDSSNVNVEHEKIMLRGDNETMSKNDLIKNIKEQGGEPCDILDCGVSRIKRKGKEKSLSDFLKHPSFKNEKDGLTENKIKRKIRIILNC